MSCSAFRIVIIIKKEVHVKCSVDCDTQDKWRVLYQGGLSLCTRMVWMFLKVLFPFL